MENASIPNRLALVYVAGPYRSTAPKQKRLNILRAREAGQRLKAKGLCFPVVPHLLGDGPDPLMLSGTMALMRRCDAVLVLPGYSSSIGTLAERADALERGQPLFYSEDELSEWLKRRVS